MKTTILIFFAAVVLGAKVGSGQSAPASAAGDPFLGAIETMKHSVAALACIATDSKESRTVDRPGSAFFISRAGDFLTAAHVILDMQQRERACPITAISITVENRDPDARNEAQVWFPFRIPDCRIDRDLDVAACTPVDDLSVPRPGMSFKITPVKLEWSIPPDGAYVAFTGFPLGARDPITSRTTVAARRTIWQDEKPRPELLLDRTAWPGSSGSPVYLVDGSVIGILVQRGIEEATGLTMVRPVSVIRKMLSEKMLPMAAVAGVPEQKITVCMDPTNHEVYSAQMRSSKMFAGIGIKLRWQDLKKCYPGSVVITLAYVTPESVLPGALASADYEHDGIVIFYDRVRQQRPGKEAYVMAHVLAHEITHILQGIGHHSDDGLMKAHWEPKDFSEMLFKPLPFAAEDIELIRRGLNARESGWMLQEQSSSMVDGIGHRP